MNGDELIGKLVDDRFRIDRLVGSGAGGCVFSGKDVNNGRRVAIKIETIQVQEEQGFAGLQAEKSVYKSARRNGYRRRHGFPECHHYGLFRREYRAMVIDLLEENLEQFLSRAGGRLGISTVLRIGLQGFDSIQRLHNLGFVHRDIKPNNFMLGRDSNKLFIIDFGIAKRFIDVNTQAHVEFADGGEAVGCMEFASLCMDNGVEPSRRDDLESLVYTMVYLFKGRLPWSQIGADEVDEEQMKEDKLNETEDAARLCDGMPAEIATFYTTVTRLEFEEKPDYVQLRSLLQSAIRRVSA